MRHAVRICQIIDGCNFKALVIEEYAREGSAYPAKTIDANSLGSHGRLNQTKRGVSRRGKMNERAARFLRIEILCGERILCTRQIFRV